jgi:cellulose synthase (UDP-forming)
MTFSETGKSQDSADSQKVMMRVRIATLLMGGVLAVSAAFVAGWFSRENRFSNILQQLERLQEHPPLWLEVPLIAGEYLLVPTVILLLIVLGVMRISPQPRPWSRSVVVSLLLLLTVRYLLWRSLSTLNLSNPLNAVFSVVLLFFELITFSSNTIQLFLMLNLRERHREADRLSIAVISGLFTPSVDILIPTYDEPTFILKRSVIGCQALDYGNKKIYLLDDTKRPEVKVLAEELGCEYVVRSDNRYAKAGNLNHAIAQTQGELIVVFDADFVPTKNFLTRTVGFFQDPQIALVQTHQSFYNPDPVARNIGLENELPQEVEIFSRFYQPLRDGVDTALCYGSSFLVRRSTLDETGGFVTDSLSEDYFTGIRLAAQGSKVIFLGESLSAGLSAENMTAHIAQRLRWARGTLQAFFIKSNPLTISGLSLVQRLAHLDGLLQWFTSISRVGFLLMPLAYAFLDIIPLRTDLRELVYFFLPYYGVQLATFSWLNLRSRSALISDIYSVAQCFPVSLTVIQTMLRPFSKGFKVTPKGISRDRYIFNWRLALPLILLFVLTAISLWRNLGVSLVVSLWQTTVPPETAILGKGITMGWIWSSYNLVMIGIAVLILMDVPKADMYEWFDLRRTVQLQVNDQTFWGITTMISEGGAEIALTQAFLTDSFTEPLPVRVKIMEEQLELQATILAIGWQGEFPTLRLRFEALTLPQERRLVELLFCRPGQWKKPQSPGELRSLWLLLKSLLTPRVLFDRKVAINPITVAKV